MKKEEFLKKLDKKLNDVTIDDRLKTIEYYSEMIDDRIEDGLTMDEAIEELGNIDEIISEVKSSLSKSEYNDNEAKGEIIDDYVVDDNRTNPNKKSFTGGMALVLILGFPIWFSLFAAAASIILSLFIAMWGVALALCVSTVACAFGGAFGIFGGIALMISTSLTAGGMALAWALMALGAALMSAAVLKYVIKFVYSLSIKLVNNIKGFIRRYI